MARGRKFEALAQKAKDAGLPEDAAIALLAAYSGRRRRRTEEEETETPAPRKATKRRGRRRKTATPTGE